MCYLSLMFRRQSQRVWLGSILPIPRPLLQSPSAIAADEQVRPAFRSVRRENGWVLPLDTLMRARGCLPATAWKATFALLTFCVWCAAPAAPAPTNMLPITATGWNRDLVVEDTAAGPPYTNYAAGMNAGEGKGFYQTGLPTYPWGMPPSGAFVSMVGDNTMFQLQLYTASNALVLSPDTGLTNGTLT